jgi:proteasome accessory factor C
MADSAIVRTSRALDLIPYLVEHSGVSIQELAIKFATTPQEISETLNTLFLCGLPGYTHLELIDISTEDGVVSVIDPQNLNRPRKLSQQEIVSLLLGLDNLQSFSQIASSELLKSAREKLVNLLANMEILQQVDVVKSNPFPWVQNIENAIQTKTRLNIIYQSIGSEAKTLRSISPRRLYGRSGSMYSEALNDEGFLRHYRLDRITSLEISSLSYLENINEMEPQDFQVDALIPKSALNFLESVDGLVEKSEIIGDFRRVLMTMSHTNWLLRALASIPGEVRILTPEWFRVDFQSFAGQALENYR